MAMFGNRPRWATPGYGDGLPGAMGGSAFGIPRQPDLGDFVRPTSPIPAPEKNNGFFSKDGAWRNVVGGISDGILQSMGQRSIYAPAMQQQKQLQAQQQQREADRTADKSDWLWKEQWKLNNQAPEMTAYQKELKAAGIDPASPEGLRLVRQKVQNTADPLIQVPWTDPATGETMIRGVPASALRAPSQGASGPPQAAADHLRKNPGLAADFDAKYGPGSAERILGGAGPGQRPFP